MWDARALDVAAQIDLNSASPQVFANLLGASTRLVEVLTEDADTMKLSSTAGFEPTGFVWVGGELVGYGAREPQALTGLVRGLASVDGGTSHPAPQAAEEHAAGDAGDRPARLRAGRVAQPRRRRRAAALRRARAAARRGRPRARRALGRGPRGLGRCPARPSRACAPGASGSARRGSRARCTAARTAASPSTTRAGSRRARPCRSATARPPSSASCWPSGTRASS